MNTNTNTICYYNGKIITMNEQQPEAEALVIRNGLIVDIGLNEEILAEWTNVETIDLEGRGVLPGFIDSHSHITSSQLFAKFAPPPIGTVDSIGRLIEEAKAYLEKNPLKQGEWFLGMGYDNSSFPDGRHPNYKDLDQISTQYPIVMLHTSGHIGVVNSKAMELLTINKDTPVPAGGSIARDPETDELTGFLEEAALTHLVLRKMPLPTKESNIKGILRAQEMYASYGITTAQDGSISKEFIELIDYCDGQGLLDIDLYAYLAYLKYPKEFLQEMTSREQKEQQHFTITGVKLFLDGSPQAKTAWLTKPYHVVPEGEEENYCGYPVMKEDEVVCNVFKDCLNNNWQVLVHCNGDGAADQFIQMYEKARQETGITTDIRPVMVHAQTVREDQLDKMKELGIIPSFFHDHTYFWGDYHLASSLGGERGRRISPLRSATNRGMDYTLHQDTPVIPPNMILTIHNAVNRITKNGQEIGVEYAATVMEALKAVTINAAYQCFEEERKGSLEKGKLGDLVIVDQSPLEVAQEQIKEIKVLGTIKGGKEIYRANRS